jgi:hypothetical protein
MPEIQKKTAINIFTGLLIIVIFLAAIGGTLFVKEKWDERTCQEQVYQRRLEWLTEEKQNIPAAWDETSLSFYNSKKQELDNLLSADNLNQLYKSCLSYK